MELKIKISDSVYKKIQEYDAVSFDELLNSLMQSEMEYRLMKPTITKLTRSHLHLYLIKKKRASLIHSIMSRKKS